LRTRRSASRGSSRQLFRRKKIPSWVFSRNIKIRSDDTNLAVDNTKSVGRQKLKLFNFLLSDKICVVRHKIRVPC
jgi:hypothetical protein